MSFATKETPVHMDRVTQLGEHFWSPIPNDICPYTIVVAALFSDTEGERLPPLMMLSPPEYAWGFLFAIEDAINTGATDTEFKTLRRLALSFTVRVEVVENNHNRLWRAHQLRQSDAQVGHVAKQTPAQCIFSVLAVKVALEKEAGQELGAEQTCLAWQTNVKMAACAEPMKTSYIDAVLTIWRRCMQDPVCRDLIQWQDGQSQPVFDSIYKLEAIVKKASTIQHITYCIGFMIDMVFNQGASPGELAVGS